MPRQRPHDKTTAIGIDAGPGRSGRRTLKTRGKTSIYECDRFRLLSSHRSGR